MCAWAFVALSLRADPGDYEGKLIAQIVFEPREQPLEPSETFAILPLKRDAPLQMADVRKSIERLYATGRYADIQVEAIASNGKVIIRFLTQSSWFIGRVSVSGDIPEPPSRGQLASAAGLDSGQPFDEANLKSSVEGIRRVLEDNGFYQPGVTSQLERDARTQQVNIVFVVSVGKRARFDRPDITGHPQMPVEKIVSATKWKNMLGWKSVTQSRVQGGLEHVRDKYRKQDRLMNSVVLKDMKHDPDTRRAKPTLEVEAGPQVEVRTFGAKVSKGKLRRLIPIYEERAVDRDLLVEGARQLRDYFQAQGYFDAEVEVKEQRISKAGKASIDYLINLGHQHKLIGFTIQGNRYFDTATLRERMLVTPSSLQFRRGRYSESLRRRDEQTIADLYRFNGFRDVKVTSSVGQTRRKKVGELTVVFSVEEGPQWLVSSLDIKGVESAEKEHILSLVSSAQGQPFGEYSVAVDRDSILAYYFANGYPDATFEWSALPAKQPNRMDVRFTVDKGQQQFVREVLVSGLETARPRLVYRNLRLNPGEPLSPLRMTETQRRLNDLGIFAKVDSAIQNPDGVEKNKFVLYQMEEAKRYTVTGGVGAEASMIASASNPAGQPTFAPRVSLDVSRLNLLGLGHTVSFRSLTSTLQQRALLNYMAPRFRGVEGLSLALTGLFENSKVVRTFTARRWESAAQLSQRLSKANTAFYRFAYRKVTVDESSLLINPFLIPLLSQPVRIGIASLGFIQDRRDDPVDSHKGIYNTVDIGLAAKAFGSETNYFRFLGRNSTYHAIGRKLILARTTTFGVMTTYNMPKPLVENQDVPLPERFFSGGAASHRGFSENQAGPRDPLTGFPLGGKALLMNGTELRFPLLGDNIGGVLFHDAGNVYAALDKISFRVTQPSLTNFDYMVHAIGMGVRYRTPIGPVRLDLAYSINSPRFIGYKGSLEDISHCGAPGSTVQCVLEKQRISRFQFHFSIGQTF